MKEAMGKILLIMCLIAISRHLFLIIERVTTLEKIVNEHCLKEK